MQNQIIDVAIGLALAFMVVSVLVSAVQEFLAGLLDSRSAQLEKGIKCLLFGNTDPQNPDEKKFIEDLFKHPLLFNLSPGKRMASYLPANNFAKALVEVASARYREAGRTMEGVRDLANAVNSDSWKQLLAPLEAEAKGNIELLRHELEGQYHQMMDRVSGWYKRRAQWFMLLYGFLLAAMLNVDALELTSRLWSDPVARAVAVASASELAKQPKTDPQQAAQIEKSLAEMKVLQSLPIGWPTKWSDDTALPADDKASSSGSKSKYILFSFVGWFITALAASLGAPFWFDAIGKLVKLKSAGATPERSTKTKSEVAAAAAVAIPPVQEPVDNRNAIVDLYAQKHNADKSYRPITAEERW